MIVCWYRVDFKKSCAVEYILVWESLSRQLSHISNIWTLFDLNGREQGY